MEWVWKLPWSYHLKSWPCCCLTWTGKCGRFSARQTRRQFCPQTWIARSHSSRWDLQTSRHPGWSTFSCLVHMNRAYFRAEWIVCVRRHLPLKKTKLLSLGRSIAASIRSTPSIANMFWTSVGYPDVSNPLEQYLHMYCIKIYCVLAISLQGGSRKIDIGRADSK